VQRSLLLCARSRAALLPVRPGQPLTQVLVTLIATAYIRLPGRRRQSRGRGPVGCRVLVPCGAYRRLRARNFEALVGCRTGV